MDNVDELYRIVKENNSTSTNYDEHGDNTIHLANDEVSSRPVTFTVLDSSKLEVDVAAGDFRFEVDGVITDDFGSYDMGIKQAEAQGTLRLDYPERIYEFASKEKFEEYLSAEAFFTILKVGNYISSFMSCYPTAERLSMRLFRLE